MIAAREANMTRDTIDRAIKRGSGGDADANYDEVRYEGYGPGGVARDRRGADQQPQPHRRRGALELQQVRRQSRRDQQRRPSCSTAGRVPLSARGRHGRRRAGEGDRGRRRRRGRAARARRARTRSTAPRRISTRCARRSRSRSASRRSAKLTWRPKTTAPVEGETAADPARPDRGAGRQRRRPERLRQFRGVGRRSGEVRGLKRRR